jgi:cell wall-associated NlpC family hydrolase
MPLTFLAALIAVLLVAVAPAAAQVPTVPGGWGSDAGQSDQRGGHHHPWSGWDDEDGEDEEDEAPAPAPAPVEDPGTAPGNGWLDGDELQPPGIGEDPVEELLPPAGARPVVKGSQARLGSNGAAYAPSKAPTSVKRAIWAANQLKRKPYKWGGGHGGWKDSGYDCSGSTSYVLHAAGLLGSPMVSGNFARYGKSGVGRWISIYANNGHVFMVIAGMRFDTSPYGAGGKGPRWRVSARPAGGFKVRHPAGL